MKNTFLFINKFVPYTYKKWVEENLRYSGFTMSSWKFVGLMVLYQFSFALLIATFLYFLNFALTWVFLGWIAGLFVVFAIFNSIIVLVADGRAKFVEEMLPDLLQLMAANMRSGINPERALLLSARPEFGFLAAEIKVVAKQVFSGATIEEALEGISYRVKSKILSTTTRLINEGIKKGGELTRLLEQTAEDIRNTRILKKEVSAQVTVYAIFIFFATAIGAPFLYGISTFLAGTMTKLGKLTNIEQVALPKSALITIHKVSIDPNFLSNYSLAALTITSIFGGILIGLLLDGSEKSGIKFIPIMLIMSLLIFFVVKLVIAQNFVNFIV